eukprot:gene9777-11416_t
MENTLQQNTSAAQLAELKESFLQMDADGDGFITASELRGAMGESANSNEIEEMIRQADTDGNGQVDYNEFIQMMTKD